MARIGRLEGAHVRLDPLELEHVPALAAVGLDPAIWRWSVTTIASADDMARYVAQALAERDAGTALPFAQVERASGTIVGSTRLANLDRTHGRVEIGWTWLGPPWQRTAINTEAKLLLLQYAFDDLKCRRVEFKTDALNEQSRRAIQRLGAVEEGTLRHHMVTETGRPRDSVYFSVLAAEWPAVRARLRQRLADRPSRIVTLS